MMRKSPFHVAIALAAASALVVGMTLWAISFTYGERNEYRSERDAATPSLAEQSAAVESCLNHSDSDELAACIRDSNDSIVRIRSTYADLHAQQDMAAYAHGLLWLTALASITGGFGLVALIWTFVEQRKLTQNQSRAYLEIRKATLVFEGIDINTNAHFYSVRVHVRNYGHTPALNVRLQLKMRFIPETDEVGGLTQDPIDIEHVSGGTPEIPAQGTYSVYASGDGPAFPDAVKETVAWRYEEPSIVIDGTLSYRDVFSRQDRTLPVRLSNSGVRTLIHGPVELLGGHNSRIEDEAPAK